VRIGTRVRTTLVVFAPDDLEPLLGAYTLEAFLLAVDAANRRLIPVSGLLKPMSVRGTSRARSGRPVHQPFAVPAF
jgi:hypothetical protein